MPIHQTIHSNFWTPHRQFDIGRFVESIVLFNMTILADASNLPGLILAVGKHGVISLIDAGLLSVNYSGPSGQANLDYISPGTFTNRPLDRPLRYGFDTYYIDFTKPENGTIEARLQSILRNSDELSDVTDADLMEIHTAVLDNGRLVEPQSLVHIGDFREDLAEKPDLISALLLNNLADRQKIPIFCLDFTFDVEEIYDHVFQLNTNLHEVLGISPEQLHESLKDRFFEITSSYMAIRNMRAVEAVCGLSDAHAKIAAKRIDYISQMQTQADTRPTLAKILEVTDAPTLDPGTSINVDALITLRESTEARAFRDWVQNRPDLDNDEIRELLGGWRERAGDILMRPHGGLLRWLTSTGIGYVMQDPTGIVSGSVDVFLGSLLPNTGPLGFITNEYNSFVRSQN